MPVLEHGNARGVVAAVLEPLEPLDQDGDARPMSDVADDSAHERGSLDDGLEGMTCAIDQLARALFLRGFGDHAYDGFGAGRAHMHPFLVPAEPQPVCGIDGVITKRFLQS